MQGPSGVLHLALVRHAVTSHSILELVRLFSISVFARSISPVAGRVAMETIAPALQTSMRGALPPQDAFPERQGRCTSWPVLAHRSAETAPPRIRERQPRGFPSGC